MAVDFIFAIMFMVMMVICIYIGYTAGTIKRDAPPKTNDIPPEDAAERKRLIAEQQAFDQLFNYNTDRAYGLTPNDDEE